MEREPQRILYLTLWLTLFQLFLNLGNTMEDQRKLIIKDSHPDFISIDCGASNAYTDPETGISYQTDTGFVETGTNFMVSPESRSELDYHFFGRQVQTLRSFPEGKRNCYTLRPKQGKNTNYLVRAFFGYGNYDGKNQSISFDLYLGVNYWSNVDTRLINFFEFKEIIHTPTSDTIHVCLVKIGKGIPFISALELRPLNNSVYLTSSPSQSLLVYHARIHHAGSTDSSIACYRYPDDTYDRVWTMLGTEIERQLGWHPFQESVDIDLRSISDSYKLPAQVLKSAVKALNRSFALNFDFDSLWSLQRSFNYYVIFHFVEMEQLLPGQRRVINITLNDKSILPEPIALEYLKPVTVTHFINQDNVRFSISATSESDAPPIFNAFEVFRIISPLAYPTNKTDVDAILDIKNTYKISKVDWQGDPCVPSDCAWEGLFCSFGINNDSNARITSLNLSMSKLTGHIAPSFTQLTELEFLDLSGNDLSGSIPEFLAELSKLRVLNLRGNKLAGPIPKALKDKSDLQMSLDDNPDLCLRDSCKRHKSLILLIASLSALTVAILFSLGIWIFRMKQPKGGFTKEESLKPRNHEFSYSNILEITNNFQNLIGEGGFGKVYLGNLKNDTQVAVKLLSQSSSQGHREFRSEVELLMVVHHRNLVSLIGYCEENSTTALVFEYMANGDLRRHLSGNNRDALKWKNRLHFALDAAHGLDYLHNGCKPPIVHRDLKTTNILLDENMEAKIADFGLSRAFANDIDTHVSTRPAGTVGYLDPEFHKTGNLTKGSDIYSFGIILLELITGKRAAKRQPDNNSFSLLLHWVTPKFQSKDIKSIVDPELQGQYSVDSAWKFLEIAMSCTAPSAIQRPDISQVVVELRECLAMETNIQRTTYNPNSDISTLSCR